MSLFCSIWPFMLGGLSAEERLRASVEEAHEAGLAQGGNVLPERRGEHVRLLVSAFRSGLCSEPAPLVGKDLALLFEKRQVRLAVEAAVLA